MKVKFLLFAAVLVAGFSACKKDSNNSPAATADNTMSWTIDGKSHTAKLVTFASSNYNTTDTAYFITAVDALDTTENTMEVDVVFPNSVVKTGTYSDSSGLGTVLKYFGAKNSDIGFSTYKNYSVITITRADSIVEGTFSGPILSTIDGTTIRPVTDGKFKVNLKTVTQTP